MNAACDAAMDDDAFTPMLPGVLLAMLLVVLSRALPW
jgi:hypothetical protein